MWNRIYPALMLAALLSLPAPGRAEDYSRIARLSFIEGHVSFQHPGEVDWTDASANLALQPGDRIYTGEDGKAEIEFDEGSVLRLAEKTDVELESMSENLLHIRVLLGLCTLTRHANVSIDVSTPAASFHTQRPGVYRFDVTETGSSDGIVRKGGMLASIGSVNRQLDKGELIHVEADGQASPIISRYDERDGWDEWTDRRAADQVAYVSTKYVPDYVYMGVSDLDRYGRWVEIGTYGYGWVPYYVGQGWSPYWEGRWCYRPYWGWTWVSYEPWGWLPYHYGSWYFTAGFGWCWLPGPSYGFHFWSPGLVRFYNGPGWVSWAPLGPGDYYSVHNYCYNPRYSHYLNNIRLAQHRGADDLMNRHIPGAFRTEPTEHFVNGGQGRNAKADSVAEVGQPWKNGRMVTDRLDIAPTPRSYHPVVSTRVNAGRAEGTSLPVAARHVEGSGAAGPAVVRVGSSGVSTVRNPLRPGRTAPGDVTEAGVAVGAGAVSPMGSPPSGRTPQNNSIPPARVWSRVEDRAVRNETDRAPQPGTAAPVGVNSRSSGRTLDAQVEGARGVGAASGAYDVPRPVVIERGSRGQAETRTYPDKRPEQAPRNEARPGAPPGDPPSYQRYDNRTPSEVEMRGNGRPVRPPVAAPDRNPSYSRPATRPDDGGRGYTPSRPPSSGTNGPPGAPSPAWNSGRSQAVRPSPPGIGQPPSWGGRGAPPPATGPGGSSRSTPQGGNTSPSRGKDH